MTIAIQEALVCPFIFEDSLHVALVLRRGRQCYLLTTLHGLLAAVSSSPDGLESISSSLSLPSRLLDGEEGALLARKTILADHEGTGFYEL